MREAEREALEMCVRVVMCVSRSVEWTGYRNSYISSGNQGQLISKGVRQCLVVGRMGTSEGEGENATRF